MGHSVQTVGDRWRSLHDTDTLVLMRILLELSDKEFQLHPVLGSVFSLWEDAIAGYGTGVIELNLELITGDQSARDQFLRYLTVAEDLVTSYGDVIPKEEVKARWKIRGHILFVDYPVSGIRKVIDALRQLLM